MNITKPTLLIDEARTKRNIECMARKVSNGPGKVRFRPHFKTHQSAAVGEWFREYDVSSITVSSVDMAQYFASHGWRDMTLAVLANPLQMDGINELAGKCALGLLVDTPERVGALAGGLTHEVRVWMKIDTGYHRTGVGWDDCESILAAAKEIRRSTRMDFSGLLTHAGHAYHAESREEVAEIFRDTAQKMKSARDFLTGEGFSGLEISVGDTPTASVVERFSGIDEMRCGNFVYNDLQQWRLGACAEDDIAAAVACPVLSTYPERNEVVIYGGAVHLSKESMIDENGATIFGKVALLEAGNRGWGEMLEDTFVSSLSQEHGIIKTTTQVVRTLSMGDIVAILPVHSCLAVDLLKNFSSAII